MAERQRRAAEKSSEVVTDCPPKRKGRPKGSKNKPKPAVLAMPTDLVPVSAVRADHSVTRAGLTQQALVLLLPPRLVHQ